MMIAGFLTRRRRLRMRLLTLTRLGRMKAILPGIREQGFPRWLPLALHWKPASRRRPPTAPRAQSVSHLHLIANHLHAQLQVFAGGILTRTIACARAHASPERIFRSMAGPAPPPWRRSRQRDASKTHPAGSSAGELRAPWSGICAPLAPRRESSGHKTTPYRALVTSAELRRAGAGQTHSRGLHGQPTFATSTPTAPSNVARLDRLWPRVARIEQRYFVPAQRQDAEPPLRVTQEPAFSCAPELVWRKDPSSRKDAARDAAASEPQVAGRSAMSTAAGTTVAQSPSQPERALMRKPVSFSDLEPTAVDRLAEDVIRRVERRARIERERRGL